MKKIISSIILMVAVTCYAIQPAQPQRGNYQRNMGGVTITGKVVDPAIDATIEYANIILIQQKTQKQFSGTTSDKEGLFVLKGVKPGVYTLQVKFMGYHQYNREDIRVKPGQEQIDLGKIELEQAILMLEGVQVEAEEAPIEYKIDKKVINVSKQFTSLSGSAVEVLENVPSVRVDIDGNVSLRGSSSFMVLIDNRPSVLDANEALQQIPASSIENIEIITNPSAKYDPDGTSGIINIITKKKSLNGQSGMVNLNAGLDEKYGGDFLINFRQEKFTAYVSANYNSRNFPGTSKSENRTFSDDTTSYIYSSGDSKRKMESYGIRGGLDLYPSKNDLIRFGFRYGYRSMNNNRSQDYDEWTIPGFLHNLYTSSSIWKRDGDYYSLNMDYQHKFAKKGHEISAAIQSSHREGDEEATNQLLQGNTITSGQSSTENGPGDNIRVKMDYTLPLRENDKFEAGFQSRISESEDGTTMSDYEPVTGIYVLQPQFSHSIQYNRKIHSIYTIYSGETGPLGFQGGLRGEYTYRTIELVGEAQEFKIDRWDLFPTVHFSYEFSKGNQTMVSYTRRIERPRGYYLEPFLTWTDAYNVRQGNPGLKPEYIDSFEWGYQKQINKSIFSIESYYRITNNKVERVRSIYETNIFLHSIENVGKDYTLGVEMMVNHDLIKWWNLNLMGDVYRYRVEGVLYDSDFSRKSNNWSARLNNTFKLGTSTRIQINGMYNSPTVSSQGRREGFFMANAGVKQEFIKNKLSATLQIRDIFSSSKHEHIYEGPGFYSSSEHERKSPMVTIDINI